MYEIGLIHKPRRKPNGITKADEETRKSDDLVKRNFTAENPLEKAVTDITEISAKDGKLCISAIFDCFNSAVLGLSMSDNIKAELCVKTLENACCSYLNSDMRLFIPTEAVSTQAQYIVRQSVNIKFAKA